MLLSNKIFLITGATGRLGTETIERLERLGAKVVPIVLRSGEKKPKRVDWKANCLPLILTEKNLLKLPTPHYVINFHWKTNRNLSFSQQLNFDIKYSLFENIFFWEWLSDKKIKKFINISSVKIFNPSNNKIISALSFPNPISPYGIAKTLSESYFTNLFDPTKVMNVRLSSVAAVGEHPSHLISQLYQSAFLNKKIKIYTGIKSYVMYIQEAIDLIIACALYGKEEKYNLGGKGYFNECIVSKFEKISNKKTITEFINVLPTLPEIKYKFDNNKFPQKFIRRFSLEKLLTDYIENRLLLDL